MPTYLYQYRREQRAEEEFEADSQEKAEELAEAWMNALSLDSTDDVSDDPGELELLEIDGEAVYEPVDSSDAQAFELPENVQHRVDSVLSNYTQGLNNSPERLLEIKAAVHDVLLHAVANGDIPTGVYGIVIAEKNPLRFSFSYLAKDRG